MSDAAGQSIGALPGGQGPDALVAETRRVLDAALPAGATVVVAVSGGPDSTGLAFLARRARGDLDAHVAHVRHGLRDDAADAAVAAEHAAALGLSFHERHVRVADTGEGLAAAARQARYEALAGVAAEVGARGVLVGHTADDQAETVVLNLARGAGLAGLAGMDAVTRPAGTAADGGPGGADGGSGGADAGSGGAGAGSPVAVSLVRPLLRLRRADVHAFVADAGLATVTDPSNRDPTRRRVRAREEVLPALARLSGAVGDPVGALTRLADLARADAEALDALADERARAIVAAWGPARAVRTADLDTLPRAVASRVLRRVLGEPVGAGDVDAATTHRVVTLAAGQSLHAPGGVWVTRGGGWLAAVPSRTGELSTRRVAVPGATPLPELGLALHAEATSGDTGAVTPAGVTPPGTAGPARGLLPAGDELAVRARRPGDRLGRRPLSELLAEAGVPRALRGLVPVVAASDDAPRWVPGVGQADTAPQQGPAVRLWLAPLR